MTGSLRTVHVALVEDERVLLDDAGRLPAFTRDVEADGPHPTATASTLLADAAHLGPVVVLDGANRLHVVGPRDGVPDSGRWVALDDLPAGVREPVTTVVRQHRGTPPAGRPDWYAPRWHDEVEAWLDAVLAGRGRRRTGPLRTHRVWSISAVHTVATDRGTLWFKASCEHFSAEAAIVETIARHLPDLVPEVVAVERRRGWLLTEPLPGREAAGAPADVARALAPLWAAAQVASLGWLDELRGAGAPDRGLDATLSSWREALANPELDGLSDDERRRLGEVVPVVEARLRELWACGFPDTLGHGDLHDGNVARDGADLRVFDWSDGCITHPFLDGTHLAHWISERDGGDAADRTPAVLAPWREAFPNADFDRAVELAPLADTVFQTVTFDRLTRAGEAGTGDLDGVVLMLTRKVLAAAGPQPRIGIRTSRSSATSTARS
ncbi:hypothetical protein GCM10023339_04040 [Alloalcanivorax gelatiniphagus]